MVLLLDAEIRMDGRVQQQHAPLLTQVLMPVSWGIALAWLQMVVFKPKSSSSSLKVLCQDLGPWTRYTYDQALPGDH